MDVATPRHADAVTVTAWRDADDGARAQPGMCLGTMAMAPAGDTTGDSTGGSFGDRAGELDAQAMFDRGARFVRLAQTVDASGATGDDVGTVRALVTVRELTRQGIAVDWRLRLGPADEWQVLGHLYPPTEVVSPGGADAAGEVAGSEIVRAWKDAFHLGLCLERRGPGFVQVRDRRGGELRSFTIDESDYLAAIDVLRFGAHETAVDPEIVTVFEDEALAVRVGAILWWAPFRVKRWPFAAMSV